MPAEKSKLHPLRQRMDLFLSGRAPSDPFYLTNRKWQQKLKLALLIAVPVLLLVALVTAGAANRLRVDQVAPDDSPLAEAAPSAEAPPPAVPQTPLFDLVSASTDLDVVNMRIANDSHPPMVTGLVRNKTERKVKSVEVSYYLADTAGSLVGTDSTEVTNLQPHGSVAFRMPLKIARARYVFVRDAHPN